MPGENCEVLGCSTSFKHKIAIFKVPTKGNEDSIDKIKKVIDLITRDRVIDKSLQSQIEKTLFVFERHYSECKMRRRKFTLCILRYPPLRIFLL